MRHTTLTSSSFVLFTEVPHSHSARGMQPHIQFPLLNVVHAAERCGMLVHAWMPNAQISDEFPESRAQQLHSVVQFDVPGKVVSECELPLRLRRDGVSELLPRHYRHLATQGGQGQTASVQVLAAVLAPQAQATALGFVGVGALALAPAVAAAAVVAPSADSSSSSNIGASVATGTASGGTRQLRGGARTIETQVRRCNVRIQNCDDHMLEVGRFRKETLASTSLTKWATTLGGMA